jgi:hypothetical protein
VHTRSSSNAKQECYALVPYSLEAASPFAEAAQVASSAAAEKAGLAQELTRATNILGLSDRTHVEAMDAAQPALAAAEAAKQHAAIAEASAGYNEVAIALEHDLYQIGQATDKALTLAGTSPTRLSALVTLAAEHCGELAEQLPAKCSQSADPEPAIHNAAVHHHRLGHAAACIARLLPSRLLRAILHSHIQFYVA